MGLRAEVELCHLSEAERNIAQDIWEKYGRLPIWDEGGLIEYTHNLPEWEDPRPQASGLDAHTAQARTASPGQKR